MRKIVTCLIMFAFILLLLEGCSSTPKDSKPITIESIELSEQEIHLSVGEEYEIKAKIRPKESEEDITWSTTNNAVIRLQQNGKITALEDGVAIVTVKSENGIESESCWVYVETPKAYDELNQEERSIYFVLTDKDVLYQFFKEPSSVSVRDVKKIAAKDSDGKEFTMGSGYYMTLSGENSFGGKSVDTYVVYDSYIYDVDSYIQMEEKHGSTNIHPEDIDNLDLSRLNRALKEYFDKKGW